MSEWRGLHHHEHEYPSDSGAYCRTCAASYYDPQWVRTGIRNALRETANE